MVNLKDPIFGNAGQGQDDTAAIQAWIAAADSTGGEAYAPAGEYLHTGFSIPRGVTVRGENRTKTIFKLMDGANSLYNIQMAGPQIYLKNFTVECNKANNTIGDGIVTTSAGSYFSGITDVNVHKCEGIALDVILMHNGYINNFSSDRCGVGIRVKASVALSLDTVDLSRYLQYGLWVQGNPHICAITARNLYMESASNPPAPTQVAAIYLESLRNKHMVNITDVFINGHMNELSDTVGIKIFNPLSMHNARITKILAQAVATMLTTSNTSNENCTLKLGDISYEGGTTPIPPQDGVLLNWGGWNAIN